MSSIMLWLNLTETVPHIPQMANNKHKWQTISFQIFIVYHSGWQPPARGQIRPASELNRPSDPYSPNINFYCFPYKS